MSLFPFDDAECRDLAAAHGTPVFAYRLAVAEAQYLRLRAALPARVRIAYAVKAGFDAMAHKAWADSQAVAS